MLEQIGRLKKLLEDKGVNVITETIMGMCEIMDDGELSKTFSSTKWVGFNKRCANVEAVISLCCTGGVFGLRQRLGKDVRIVSGMRDAGTWQAFQVLDEEKKFILIDRDRSRVIRWKKAS